MEMSPIEKTESTKKRCKGIRIQDGRKSRSEFTEEEVLRKWADFPWGGRGHEV